MAKLRKMLGDVQSPECLAMMKLIETQSKATLGAWAVAFAKEQYLPIYEKESGGLTGLREICHTCEEYLAGNQKLAEIKPALREATQIARGADDPIVQAAARAVATACSAVQTPTGTLGFLFYGAAASAYSRVGLSESAEIYDRLAAEEFKKAYDSLKATAIPDEPNPAKINWNC